MFEATPSMWWWIAGANLTAWFDWDAVGAIATTITLIVAIALARTDARRLAQRDVLASGVAVLLMSGPRLYGQRYVDDVETAEAEPEERARSYLDSFEQLSLIEHMDAFDVHTLPNVSALSDFMSAKVAAKHIARDLRELAKDGKAINMPMFKQKVANLNAYIERMANLSASRQRWWKRIYAIIRH